MDNSFNDEEAKDEATLEIEAYEMSKKLEVNRLEKEKRLYAETVGSFEELFRDFSSEKMKSISLTERQKRDYLASTLSYGDISYAAILKVVWHLYKYGFSPDIGGKFVDIGSGSGRGVIGAAFSHQFSTCIGIEILTPVFNASIKILDKWKRLILNSHKEKQSIDLYFVNGDALYLENLWIDADVVFIHWTAFSFDLLKQFDQIAAKMKPSSFFITLSHLLPNSNNLFDLKETIEVEASWGIATVHIHQRNSNPCPGVILNPKHYLDELISRWSKEIS